MKLEAGALNIFCDRMQWRGRGSGWGTQLDLELVQKEIRSFYRLHRWETSIPLMSFDLTTHCYSYLRTLTFRQLIHYLYHMNVYECKTSAGQGSDTC